MPALSKYGGIARPTAKLKEGDSTSSACRTSSEFIFTSGVVSKLGNVEDEIGSIDVDVREKAGFVSVSGCDEDTQVPKDSSENVYLLPRRVSAKNEHKQRAKPEGNVRPSNFEKLKYWCKEYERNPECISKQVVKIPAKKISTERLL